jgi:curved DNA-binding protein CbpA
MRNRQRPTNNISMTSCNKGGIKIRDTGNNKSVDPFAGLNPFSNPTEQVKYSHSPQNFNKEEYNKLDLNIENYSIEELFKLFGQNTTTIDENILKNCKKIVLKTHPDKSQLDEKYFLFFSKAFKKLQGIFEFQNKINTNKKNDTNEYFNSNNNVILDNVFENNKKLKDPNNFNEWFNEQFSKHHLNDSTETGYGDWLKSDEDIDFSSSNISKSNMASEMDKRKKKVQTLIPYQGIGEQFASTFGGSSLITFDDNFSSGSLFSCDGIGFTDLRQAYVESVIPVTEDDFNKTAKFKNINEYTRHRETLDTKPLSKEESIQQLFYENKQKDEESAALAFYYAQQSEKVKINQDKFWSGLKQLTN